MSPGTPPVTLRKSNPLSPTTEKSTVTFLLLLPPSSPSAHPVVQKRQGAQEDYRTCLWTPHLIVSSLGSSPTLSSSTVVPIPNTIVPGRSSLSLHPPSNQSTDGGCIKISRGLPSCRWDHSQVVVCSSETGNTENELGGVNREWFDTLNPKSTILPLPWSG